MALDHPGNGTLSNLGGFVDNMNGTFTFTGTLANAQTPLDGLVWPTNNHQLNLTAQQDTTRFTITLTDGTYVVTDNQTTVRVPAIGGTAADQPIDDPNAAVHPFFFNDPAATEICTLSPTRRSSDLHPGNGTLSNLGGFVDNMNGTFTFTGT